MAGGFAGVSQCGSRFVTAWTLSRYTLCPPYGEIRDDTKDECKCTAWTSEAELLERVLGRNSSQGSVAGAASKPAVPTATCRALQDWICSGTCPEDIHSELATLRVLQKTLARLVGPWALAGGVPSASGCPMLSAVEGKSLLPGKKSLPAEPSRKAWVSGRWAPWRFHAVVMGAGKVPTLAVQRGA